jgi:hypothetical protein
MLLGRMGFGLEVDSRPFHFRKSWVMIQVPPHITSSSGHEGWLFDLRKSAPRGMQFGLAGWMEPFLAAVEARRNNIATENLLVSVCHRLLSIPQPGLISVIFLEELRRRRKSLETWQDQSGSQLI